MYERWERLAVQNGEIQTPRIDDASQQTADTIWDPEKRSSNVVHQQIIDACRSRHHGDEENQSEDSDGVKRIMDIFEEHQLRFYNHS